MLGALNREIPAFAGMTVEAGMTGENRLCLTIR
jgi:hypothetical protein